MRRGKSFVKLLSVSAAAVAVTGCAVHNPNVFSAPQQQKPSEAGLKLAGLPLPGARVAVAVYNFSDQTGQFKPSDGQQTLSRAVTQGATSILIEALQQAGERKWFTVIERERLDNVLRERAVIREMRSSYLGEKTVNPQALPPLLFAGVLLEGGIIGYDSNTKTGGAGARFLGIGGHIKYREDTITIYLRAVSVKTGEVLSTVSVRKSIASVGAGADAFRYVAFKNLLEAETGFAYNEPDQLALRHAIEEAVYSLVLEGSTAGMWCLDTTQEKAEALVRKYMAERQSVEEDAVKLPVSADGRTVGMACGRNSTAARAFKPQSAYLPPQAFEVIAPEQAAPTPLADAGEAAHPAKPVAHAAAPPPTVVKISVPTPAAVAPTPVSDHQQMVFVSTPIVQPITRPAVVPSSLPVPTFGGAQTAAATKSDPAVSALSSVVSKATSASRALLAALAVQP